MNELVKPKIDNNEYKFINLSNNLEVLIIYDEKTEISATAMTINVGYYNDPFETQGLAHFLEHMLFMGTSQNEEDNYFHEFINESGGFTNAHTMEELTSFYYEVLNEHFLKSLEIFSHFFTNALLSENAIEREMKAVDSEHKKNLAFDSARLASVIKEFVKNKHPYYNFGSGNINTLSKKNIRQILFDFYDKYYSSNIMKLVVLSNIKIAEIEPKIINLFSAIKNKNVIIPKINNFPFESHNKSNNYICTNLIKMVSVYEVNSLVILWQMPNMDKFYEYKPYEYLSHLLGHESEGSIYYFLKQQEYITALYAGPFEQDSSVILYKLEIELTEKGYKHIPNIIECIYNYIGLIKKHGVNENFYNELKIIDQLAFDYSIIESNINYVSDLSMNMLKYKPQDIIYGPYKLNNFKNETMKILTNCIEYLDQKKSIVIILSKKYENIVNKKDKWYGAEYFNIEYPINIGDEFDYISSMNYTLSLPIKNKFIPQNVQLYNEASSNINIVGKSNNNSIDIINEFPIQVDYPMEYWYKKDNKFNVPKVIISFTIYSNEHFKSAINFILLNIYLRIIDDYYSSSIYYAQLCSTGYFIDIEHNYITITFFGFNENIISIINTFIDALQNVKISEKTFNFIKQNIKNYFINFIYNPAFSLVSNYFNKKIFSGIYSNQELLNAISDVKFIDITNPKKWLFNNCYTKLFVYGNINNALILSVKKCFEIFNCNDITKIKSITKIINLNESEEHIYIQKLLNKSDDNFVSMIFFEFDTIIRTSYELIHNWGNMMACALFIESYVKEKFFSQLRTKEQLGYIVRSSIKYFKDNGKMLFGQSFLIQSPDSHPVKLRKRIKTFVNDIYIELKKIQEYPKDSNDKITLYKTILKNTINLKYNSQNEEFVSLNTEIISGLPDNYIFNYKTLLINNIDNIDKKMIIEFYEKYFVNKMTRKIRIMEMYKHM